MAIAVVTGVASAATSTYFVLTRTQIATQRMLLQHVAEERERSAALLASIGLVPVDGSFADHGEVLRTADAACYAAKRSGRNRVAMHGRADTSQAA